MPTRIVSLFRNLLRKNTVEQALDDELQSSVELLTEAKMKEGLAHSEARRQALIELGGVEQVKEEVRGKRAGHLLEDLAKDLCYAFRTLSKSPGFAAVIIVSIALGIGANATVFSIANGLLWGTFPVERCPPLGDVQRGRLIFLPGLQGLSRSDQRCVRGRGCALSIGYPPASAARRSPSAFGDNW